MYMRWRLNRPEKVPKAVKAPPLSTPVAQPLNPIRKCVRNNSFFVWNPFEKAKRGRKKIERLQSDDEYEYDEYEYDDEDDEEYDEEYDYGQSEYQRVYDDKDLVHEVDEYTGKNDAMVDREATVDLYQASNSPRRKPLRIVESSPEPQLSEAEENSSASDKSRHNIQNSYAQLHHERMKSQQKLKSAWDNIISKYGDPSLMDEGDVVDLVTGEIIEDHGHLQGIHGHSDNIWVEEYDSQPIKKKPKSARKGHFVDVDHPTDKQKFTTTDGHDNDILEARLPTWSVLTSSKSPLKISSPNTCLSEVKEYETENINKQKPFFIPTEEPVHEVTEKIGDNCNMSRTDSSPCQKPRLRTQRHNNVASFEKSSSTVYHSFSETLFQNKRLTSSKKDNDSVLVTCSSSNKKFKRSVPVEQTKNFVAVDHENQPLPQSLPETSEVSKLDPQSDETALSRSNRNQEVDKFLNSSVVSSLRHPQCGDPGYNCQKPFCFTCS